MVYQISVFLENRAGQFAEITTALADNGIDMRAISVAETADYGILRMIVDNAEKATSILMQHGSRSGGFCSGCTRRNRTGSGYHCRGQYRH